MQHIGQSSQEPTKQSFDDLLQRYDMYHPGSTNSIQKVKKVHPTKGNFNIQRPTYGSTAGTTRTGNHVSQRPSDQFSRENYYQKQPSNDGPTSDLSDLLLRFSSNNTQSNHHVIHSQPKKPEKKKFTYDSDISSDVSSEEGDDTESVESGFDLQRPNIKSHLRPTRTARHARLDRYFESIHDPVRQHMDKEKQQLMDKQNEHQTSNQVPVAPRQTSMDMSVPRVDMQVQQLRIQSDVPELQYGHVELVRLPQIEQPSSSEVSSDASPIPEKKKKKSKDKTKKKSKSKKKKKNRDSQSDVNAQEITPNEETSPEALTDSAMVESPKPMEAASPATAQLQSPSLTAIEDGKSDLVSETLVEEAPKKKKKKKDKSKDKTKDKKTKKKSRSRKSASAPSSDVKPIYPNPQSFPNPHLSVYTARSNSPITQWDSASNIGAPAAAHPATRTMHNPPYPQNTMQPMVQQRPMPSPMSHSGMNPVMQQHQYPPYDMNPYMQQQQQQQFYRKH